MNQHHKELHNIELHNIELRDNELCAAVIGLGFIGAGDQVSGDAIGQQVANLDGTHAQALANHPGVRLVAGSSRDAGRRQRFTERLQVERTYAGWRDLLAAEPLDIVSIATNSPHHAEIAIACAAAGVRAILCEKPVATRLCDADRAIASCREHGTLLVVNHSRRWNPLWQAARDAVVGGLIGDVYRADVHWPSGRLGNVGTHFFDALRMVLGANPVAVSGSLDPEIAPDCRGPQFRDPGGWGIVAFDNGSKAFIHAPQNARLSPDVRLVGSLGQLVIHRDAAYIESKDGDRRALTVVNDGQTSLDRAVTDLVQCLENGQRPACSGEDGLAALEIVIGFHVSDRLQGQWVKLPLTGDERNLEVAIG